MKTKNYSTLSAADAKSGGQKQNNSIRRKWSALALGGLLFISIFALSAPPVEAECKQWNVGHGWRFKQGSTNVNLDLHQNGTVITGSAVIYGALLNKPSGSATPSFRGFADLKGTVDGTVKGDSFAVKVYWNNQDIGVYDGTIRPSGKIEGKGYEQRSPSTKVNWYSETTMKCADAKVGAGAPDWMKAAPKSSGPPTPEIKIIKPAATPNYLDSSGLSGVTYKGKQKPSGGLDVEAIEKSNSTSPPTPTPPPAAPASISANPQIVDVPHGQTHGTTTLTWNGGTAHPDAEVWVKVDDRDEKFLLQKGKGSRDMSVKAGKTYRYTLIADDKRLATVTVRAEGSATKKKGKKKRRDDDD